MTDSKTQLSRVTFARQTSTGTDAVDPHAAQTPDVFVRRQNRPSLAIRPSSAGENDAGAGASSGGGGDAGGGEVEMDDTEHDEANFCLGCRCFSAARLSLFAAFGALICILSIGALSYIIYSLNHFLVDCSGLLIIIVSLGVSLTVVWSSCVGLTLRAYWNRRDKAAAAGWYGVLSSGTVTKPNPLLPQPAASSGGGPATPAGESDAGAGGSGESCAACCGRDKWPRITCGTFGAIVVLSTFFLFGALVAFKLGSLPGYDGTLHLPGLRDTVYVERETNGIIHIRASNEHDMYFAQGVACAQERLWQMEFQRRVGSGRLSDAVGNVDAAIRIDELMRTVNFYGAAQQALTTLDTTTASHLQAYCDGVNAYLDTDPPIPLEFDLLKLGRHPDPFVPADLLVWTKLMSWQLSGNMDKELWRWDLLTKLNVTTERISVLNPPFDDSRFPVVLDPVAETQLPKYESQSQSQSQSQPEPKPEPILAWLNAWRAERNAPAPAPAPAPESEKMSSAGYLRESIRHYQHIFGDAKASNNWVVHGNRTTTGKPFLCNDPHLGLTAPSVWILFHLQSPTYNAIGSSFVGVPGVVLGRTDTIAWGVTNTGADVQDLYAMHEPAPSPANPAAAGTQYWYNGELKNYTIRTEVINIKGADPRVLRVRESVYGPVVTDIQAATDDPDLSVPPLSLRWTSLNAVDHTMTAFLQIPHATNYSEWRSAFVPYVAPSQNFIFADTAGNIGYQLPGVIPIRVAGHTGLYPVPGNGSYDWNSTIPFDALPHSFNPPKAFFVSANNRVTMPDYEYQIALDWDSGSDGYRSKRITQMILQTPKLSIADMQAIQTNYHSLLCEDFQPIVRRLQPITETGLQWQSDISNWDCSTAPDGSAGAWAATEFAYFYTQLSTLAGAEVNATHYDNPVFLFRVFNNSKTTAVDEPGCAPYTLCADWASNALDVAAANSDPVGAWGDALHHTYMQHPVLSGSPVGCLSDRSTPHGGDGSTVNVGSYDPKTMTQTAGPSYRQIVDLSDPESSLFLITLGQSGNLLSELYDSMLDRWTNGEYLAMHTHHDVHHTLTLAPQS